MDKEDTYVPIFFSALSAPALHTLSFESQWQTTWEGFVNALDVIGEKFEDLRYLQLTMSDAFEFDDEILVDHTLFGIFPNLQELAINAIEDAQVQYFLRSWILATHAEEPDGDESSDLAVAEIWPQLQLLTVRAPYDDGDDEDADEVPTVDDTLSYLGSLRLSINQPLEVWQESIFSHLHVDPLENV
ncbi:hypothetical protein NM688_g8233 [Phlebia brevispora]|uniref:Uncharacterized protein n=1 Tax=Phlebia brevispora TaxID=194682 RepID=A0ACC1RVN9_9APHY|nr:hypothetical protein NM688_g8233 [Phlebia brevispora]